MRLSPSSTPRALTTAWARKERGQSEAIARNLREMSRLAVPVICTVIGEGGSGGALAIGVGDKEMNMLQYGTYSVISPEGCASILWKSADKAPWLLLKRGYHRAASETEANRFHHSGPLGGAHRNPEAMAASLKAQLLEDLADLVC